jgi:hypothetical protein
MLSYIYYTLHHNYRPNTTLTLVAIIMILWTIILMRRK